MTLLEKEKTPEELEQEEMVLLKRRATSLGLPFSPNIGLTTLRDRVSKAMNPVADDEDSEVTSTDKNVHVVETKHQRNARLRKAASKLYRVRITCLNPKKNEHEGEFFKASNSVVGTHSRFIQFNEPWHVEKILLNMIEERKYQQFYTTTVNGKKVRKAKLVQEFGIDYLPALTPKELEKLAKAQALRDGASND